MTSGGDPSGRGINQRAEKEDGLSPIDHRSYKSKLWCCSKYADREEKACSSAARRATSIYLSDLMQIKLAACHCQRDNKLCVQEWHLLRRVKLPSVAPCFRRYRSRHGCYSGCHYRCRRYCRRCYHPLITLLSPPLSLSNIAFIAFRIVSRVAVIILE
jgi:hypothetical protein